MSVNCKKHSIVATVLNCTLCMSFCLLPHATNVPLFQISATCRKMYLCCNLNGLIKNNIQPFGTEIFMKYSGNNETEVLQLSSRNKSQEHTEVTRKCPTVPSNFALYSSYAFYSSYFKSSNFLPI